MLEELICNNCDLCICEFQSKRFKCKGIRKRIVYIYDFNSALINCPLKIKRKKEEVKFMKEYSNVHSSILRGCCEIELRIVYDGKKICSKKDSVLLTGYPHSVQREILKIELQGFVDGILKEFDKVPT